MRTNRTNENIAREFNTLYMSFDAVSGYQDDVMDSILEYAIKASASGSEYVRKNLITCKTANDCSVYWDYEPADKGDWYCRFCCGAPNSDIVVNGFVNSRQAEDSDVETFYVRLAICHNAKSYKHDLFRSHSGVLRSYAQAQDFDDMWIRMAAPCGSDYMRKIA